MSVWQLSALSAPGALSVLVLRPRLVCGFAPVMSGRRGGASGWRPRPPWRR